MVNVAGRPVGVPGELSIAGDGVVTGYPDRDGRGERFIADPCGAGRAFRTGEPVRRRADGRVELAPRT